MNRKTRPPEPGQGLAQSSRKSEASLAATGVHGRWRGLLLSCIAVAPFYTVHAAHFFLFDNATGFIQNDQPYYVANGREVFERGNGFAHPNPFDADPAAPVIYFHWLTWIYGASVKFLGLDPAVCPLVLGAIAGITFARITLEIVRSQLRNSRFLVPLYLLSMWGGGLLCIGGLLFGRPPTSDITARLFAFDPADGWWFLNWGRNVMYPTEAVYHAIAAAAWLAMLARRDGLALLAAAAIATTHPFSGLQVLLFVGGWCGYRLLTLRSAAAAGRFALWLTMLAAFLGYYLVYLNQFPQHLAMQLDWTDEPEHWTLRLPTMLLAYGPVAVLAVWRLVQEPRPWKPDVVLWVGIFCITLFLIKHDLLTANHKQPIHFTRGYEWMPLFLLGLPVLQKGLIACWERCSTAATVLAMAAMFGLATFDNLCFIVASWTNEASVPHYLTAAERETFAWIEREKLQGVVLSTDQNLCYMAGVYTSLTPYWGHGYNTPQFMDKSKAIHDYFAFRKPAAWLERVDYLLVPKRVIRLPENEKSNWRPDARWEKIYENPGCLLFRRAPAANRAA